MVSQVHLQIWSMYQYHVHASLSSINVIECVRILMGNAQWELLCTVQVYGGPRRLLSPSSYHFIRTISDGSTFSPHCCDLQVKLTS